MLKAPSTRTASHLFDTPQLFANFRQRNVLEDDLYSTSVLSASDCQCICNGKTGKEEKNSRFYLLGSAV